MEIVTVAGAVAAGTQLLKYGFEAINGVSDLTRRVRFAQESLDKFSDQVLVFKKLSSDLRDHPSFRDVEFQAILTKWRQDITQLDDLIRKEAANQSKGVWVRRLRKLKTVSREVEVRRKLSCIRDRAITFQIKLAVTYQSRSEGEFSPYTYPSFPHMPPHIILVFLQLHRPEVARAIYVLSCFHHRDIPAELFEYCLAPAEVANALALLSSYSMIKRDTPTAVLQLDPIVQAAARWELRRSPRALHYLEYALRCMSVSFPKSFRDRQNLERSKLLFTHAGALLDLAMEDGVQSLSPMARDQFVALLRQLSHFYINMGLFADARKHVSAALNRLATHLVKDTATDIVLHKELSVVEIWNGNLPTAEQMAMEVFWACHNTFGERHKETLHSLNNLANVLSDQGNLQKAQEYHQQALSVKEIEYGPDHEETLTTINNLGRTYLRQHDLSAAEDCFLRALTGRRNLFVMDHLDVLTSVSDLGKVYQCQGRLQDAEELHLTALTRRGTILGSSHPSTLESKGSLALTMHCQGRLPEAEQLYRDLATAFTNIFRPSHPDALRSQSNLAILLHTDNRIQEAVDILTNALPLFEATFGDCHFRTLEALEHLSILLQCQCQYAKAVHVGTRVRDARFGTLGQGHPDSLRSLKHVRELEEDLAESLL